MTSGKFVTTLGYERRYNTALQFEDQRSFVEYMTTGQPPRPANMKNIVAINQGHRPLTQDEPRVAPLPASSLKELPLTDRILLDLRSQDAFGQGHVPGSYSIQVSSAEFEQRVGWVLPPDRNFTLVAETAAEANLAVRKLAFVGLDTHAEGFFTFQSWREAGREETTLSQIDPKELDRRLRGNRIQVLDVRETSEWKQGHVAQARHQSFKQLEPALPQLGLDPGIFVAVVCATGKRSSTGASILLRHGFREVANVRGGMEAWNAADLPVERP